MNVYWSSVLGCHVTIPEEETEMNYIRIEYNAPDLIASDDDEELAKYDLAASCTAYEGMIRQALEEAYPGHEIEIVRHENLTGYCPAPEHNGQRDTLDAIDVAETVAEVWQEMNWLVEA